MELCSCSFLSRNATVSERRTQAKQTRNSTCPLGCGKATAVPILGRFTRENFTHGLWARLASDYHRRNQGKTNTRALKPNNATTIQVLTYKHKPNRYYASSNRKMRHHCREAPRSAHDVKLTRPTLQTFNAQAPSSHALDQEAVQTAGSQY